MSKITSIEGGRITKLALEGDLNTGDILVKFLVGDQMTWYRANPKQLLPYAPQLLQSLVLHPDGVALLAIREVHAHTPHPNLLVLAYELEAGVRIQRTIEVHEAKQLAEELLKAIAHVEQQAPPHQ